MKRRHLNFFVFSGILFDKYDEYAPGNYSQIVELYYYYVFYVSTFAHRIFCLSFDFAKLYINLHGGS